MQQACALVLSRANRGVHVDRLQDLEDLHADVLRADIVSPTSAGHAVGVGEPVPCGPRQCSIHPGHVDAPGVARKVLRPHRGHQHGNDLWLLLKGGI